MPAPRRCAPLLFATCALLLMLAGGCSGIKPYPNDLNKNLRVATKRNSGSLLTSIKMAVDIYAVKPDCSLTYEGTVQLQDAEAEIGLPPGQTSYLEFVFNNSGFLSNTSSTVSSGTLLRPQQGYRYAIEARYIDGIYNVEVIERRAGARNGRVIDPGDMRSCRPR